ncbi:MAG TPA: hypothetical protein VED59_06290, partial [Acidimicrobiales bacterium]|nr:hypothetical protein [Acidimicrobiales bacterium]
MGERQLRIRARSTTGPVAGAASYNSGLGAHSDLPRPALPAFSLEAPGPVGKRYSPGAGAPKAIVMALQPGP